MILKRFDTVHELADRQTDRQTDRLKTDRQTELVTVAHKALGVR